MIKPTRSFALAALVVGLAACGGGGSDSGGGGNAEADVTDQCISRRIDGLAIFRNNCDFAVNFAQQLQIGNQDDQLFREETLNPGEEQGGSGTSPFIACRPPSTPVVSGDSIFCS